MIKLAKAFYRGFIGGPSFDNCTHYRFILEDKLLTLDMPSSNVAAVPSTIDVSFPYNSKVGLISTRKIISITYMCICLLKTGCTCHQ